LKARHAARGRRSRGRYLVEVEAKIIKVVEAGAVLDRPFDGGER
jgi:hypothetical protein